MVQPDSLIRKQKLGMGVLFIFSLLIIGYVVKYGVDKEFALQRCPNSDFDRRLDFPGNPDLHLYVSVWNHYNPDLGSEIYLVERGRLNYQISNMIQLTDGWVDDTPVVSPSGDLILFVRGEKESRTKHIWSMNIDGSNQRQLTTGSHVLDYSPVFSQDGYTIAFFRRENVEMMSTSIVLMDVDGSNMRVIADAIPKPSSLPVFTGPELEYLSWRSDITRAYTVNIRSAEIIEISDHC